MNRKEIARDFLIRSEKGGSLALSLLCIHDGLTLLGLVDEACAILGCDEQTYRAKVEACREDGEGGEVFTPHEVELLRGCLKRALG